jgi:hypothetical protein
MITRGHGSPSIFNAFSEIVTLIGMALGGLSRLTMTPSPSSSTRACFAALTPKRKVGRLRPLESSAAKRKAKDGAETAALERTADNAAPAGYALGEDPELTVDSAASNMIGGLVAVYAAAFASLGGFQFQGRNSSIRLAG